jgi:hypothetical protein|tara:strand:- start:121 stop:597 length:477 start_codon:yes stop_codon:yes gene_type:complete
MPFLDSPIVLADIPEEETRDFSPVPDGWYDAKISDADVKNTKAGTGKYISLRFDIIGPSYQGRVVWTNLNTINPNPKAEEIARSHLGDIMRATGLAKVVNTDELVGLVLSIKVSTRHDETYGSRNEVKDFRAVEGSSMPTASAPPAASAAPPWAKKGA